MSECKRCPRCGSCDTESSWVGYAERLGAGAAAMLAAAATSFISQEHAKHVGMHIAHGVPHQRKCKKCGHTWHE